MAMFARLGLLFTACMLLAWPAAATTATAPAGSVVRYGVLASFPPYQVWPQDAPPGGADVELVRELARGAGIALELVRYAEFQDLERDLKAGRIQLASSMARTPERELNFIFTPPYTRVALALVTRTDQPSGGLAPDLSGRSVAVVSGFASEGQVDRLFPLASRVVVRSVRDGLDAVRSGRADTFLEAAPVIAELIARERLAGIGVARRFDTPSGQLHLALPPDQAALAARLAEQQSRLAPGRVDALVAAWTVRPPPPAASGPWLQLPEDTALMQRWSAGGVRVGVVGQEGPFATLGADGVAQGLSVDMLMAVLRRIGVAPVRFIGYTPETARAAVIANEIDLLLGLDESADLAPFLRFVGPYIEYPTVLIGRPEGAVFDLEQLHGRRLALTPRSSARALVDSRHPGVEVVDCADVQACIDMVSRGDAEATLADVVAAASTLARRPRADVQIVGAEPQLRRAHSLAVHARHADAVPLIKRALDHAVDTEMTQLKQRWFTRPLQAEVLRSVALRYLPWAAGTTLLLLGLWFWHARRLRAEVVRTRAAQQQAERAGQASRRLVTFLAHEVRNSLHSIIAGTELAREPQRQGAELGPRLGQSARSTLRLLNNLIDRERLDAGRLVLHPEPGPLAPWVEPVVQEMELAAQARGLVLQMRLPPDDVPLLVDGLRLQQVLRNLLANAIKYSADGVVEVELRTAPAPSDPAQACSVVLQVLDRGRGIAPAELQGVFEPFGARAAGESSAGLGLPLCRDLAQLMGGVLEVATREGGGTVVQLAFEARRAPLPAVSEAAAAAVAERALQVLVVEDAEVYGLLLVRALEQRGHQVRLVGSLAAARAALGQGGCELLLTDLNLPDGQATELLAWLQQQPAAAGERPLVVVMTTDLDGLPAGGALDAAVAVIAKSGDARALVERALREVQLAPA
jgi:two-component system sensor histidine kinase EvgS